MPRKTASKSSRLAVGYVRVSTEEQSLEGCSLDAQEERIRAYAISRGLELVAIHREEGVSGKFELRERPAGRKLVKAIEEHKASHVIAIKLDRLFRNAADALNQSERWDEAKVGLHIIDMGGQAIDTTSAMGRMFFTMAAGFAQMERMMISERVKAALHHQKASGKVYSKIPPLGFDRVDDKLVKNVGEMKIVTRIHRLRDAGMSMDRIAKVLNEDNTPSKLGGTWRSQTIANVLRIHAA